MATNGTRKKGRSRTYNSWRAMKHRCLNPNYVNYHRWGGRGITINDKWLHSFKNFLSDMGVRPEGKTLDRYPDPNGNYEPGNCRWATPKEQANNKDSIGGLCEFSCDIAINFEDIKLELEISELDFIIKSG